MSFATTSPELFVILISTFLTKSDIGIGAVVGSGMFNILGVATVGGLAATTVSCLRLDRKCNPLDISSIFTMSNFNWISVYQIGLVASFP